MSIEANIPAPTAPDPRYPIGKFKRPAPGPLSPGELTFAIESIGELASQLRNAVSGLDTAQLDTPYRDGGWTVRQLVAHVADSHMTAFFRVRMALCEDTPSVVGYDEKAFAELHDDKFLTSADFPKHLVKTMKEMYPLVSFLRQVLK